MACKKWRMEASDAARKTGLTLQMPRPLRGAMVLLLAVTCCWLGEQGFAAPPATRIQTAAGVEGIAEPLPTSSFGNFAGRSFQFTRAQDKVPDDAHATDVVSLALAAAGCAVAMRAASEASEAAVEEQEAETKTEDKFGVLAYVALWYAFNIGYNIYNKKSLMAYPYPWACALWQMCFGWLVFMPLWILHIRKTPKLTAAQAVTLAPSALGHLATHVGAVVAFHAGAVSFGHIVKASEPVVSSFLNFAFLGEVMPWQVYASLLPIIGGVVLASASELSFNWLCFGSAMASNLGSASRAVYSKKVMSKGNIGENMDSANVYAVLTIMATFMLIPISLAVEGPSAMVKGFKIAFSTGRMGFMWQMILSGFFYYMYNEVAFLALGKLDPVSHAVCNTMKRVVIIITAIVVFRTPVTGLGVLGSSVAILGTLMYSLSKTKYAK